MLKNTVYIFIVFAAVSLCSSNILAREPSRELLDQVKRSVVVIKTFNENGKPLLQGSGFFISTSRIVTSMHVLKGATTVVVQPFKGRPFIAREIAAGDEVSDIALIVVDPPSTPISILPLETSSLSNGEGLFVVSNPQGSSWKVSEGIVDSVWNFANSGALLRITAKLSPGSSGGPVLNLRGHVIGIATSHADTGDDLNFAIPGESLVAFMAGLSEKYNPLSGLARAAVPSKPGNAPIFRP
jgi:S1-C subfamily serine protease